MRKALEQLSRELVDKGLLIEAGWTAMRASVIPENASVIQLREMRMAFFAGAQHLFGSIMGILDPGAEPTDDDLKRMESISDELDTFIAEMKERARAQTSG
jgi:hypothetical protein